ncbi:MAG TPA: hypothetical protein VMV69_11520 [Pirellulales bacterium]|nr:hypothetical protein [Pirellulales bacterium]
MNHYKSLLQLWFPPLYRPDRGIRYSLNVFWGRVRLLLATTAILLLAITISGWITPESLSSERDWLLFIIRTSAAGIAAFLFFRLIRWYKALTDVSPQSRRSAKEIEEDDDGESVVQHELKSESIVTSAFSHRADEFIARIESVPLTASTEVVLVYHCLDERGVQVPPIREPLAPLVSVRMPGVREAGKRFAATVYRETIIDNINSLVRGAPNGMNKIPNAPQVLLRIMDFELEISDSLCDQAGEPPQALRKADPAGEPRG